MKEGGGHQLFGDYKMAGKQTTLVCAPNGDMFNGAVVKGIRLSDKGVVLSDDKNALVLFIKENDPDRAKTIRDEARKCVMAIDRGDYYEPQWPDESDAS